MQQCARQLTDPFEGFLGGKRYLIHDRDTKFTPAFDALLKASGVEPVLLPPRSPNLNAHCERFIRSIKEEALEQMVLLGEHALSYAIHQYLTHYHTERNHQGLDNQLITWEGGVGGHTGSRGAARAPRWPAQLLSSRGRVTRRSISTKWVRLKGSRIHRFETSSICPTEGSRPLWAVRCPRGAFGQASTKHRFLRFLKGHLQRGG